MQILVLGPKLLINKLLLMILLFSITFKVILSLLSACLLIFLSKRSEANLSKNKNFLIYTFSSVAFLSLLNKISLNSTLSLYGVGIICLFIFSIFIVYVSNSEIKDYIIINTLIIFISLGYIVLPLILLAIYILIDKYYIYIEEYLYFESFKKDNSDLNE